MLIQELVWTEQTGWSGDKAADEADLVLYFGDRSTLETKDWFEDLRARFGRAHLLGCSTGSQIFHGDINERGICATALSFEAAQVAVTSVAISGPEHSRACGEELGRALAKPDLAAVLVLSDGLQVNGSQLTQGISSQLNAGIPVSGGLAGDGADFERTLVGLDARPEPGRVAAVGFYGESMRVSNGSSGGWAEFGPKRRITRSQGNVLFELDGKPALDLYEHYLGEEDAKALPSSGLLFPLKIFDPAHDGHNVVRTILSVDREARSMTFAGDVPEGWQSQLMRGNVDRLTQGALEAARQISQGHTLNQHSLVLMVSCIGRRLLMGQRAIDEVDAVRNELSRARTNIGFYSYGEICPHHDSGLGEMHNQTMTITAISEAA